MTHLFVPHKLALLLQEKGFKENCIAYYHSWNTVFTFKSGILDNTEEAYSGCRAPIYQQVIDWLTKLEVIIETEWVSYDNKFKYTLSSGNTTYVSYSLDATIEKGVNIIPHKFLTLKVI